MACEARYIVGIDFGTTSTGIGYLYVPASRSITIDFANVKIIESWQTRRGIPKVPSRIAYDAATGLAIWGFDALNQADSLGLLKLLLLNPEDVPSHVANFPAFLHSKAQLARLDKSPVDVVADFLREVWQKFLGDIERHADHRDPLGSAPLDVVLTVPAIWPEYYRRRLGEAARRAGILNTREGLRSTTLQFITEPEAAAYKTVQQQERQGRLKVKDTFIVLDCGGATIDVITYEVVRVNPLVVREAVPGDGALYGGCILDDAFQRKLQEKYQSLVKWSEVEQDKRGLRRTLDEEWERKIKGDFDGTQKFEFEPLWKGRGPLQNFTAHELREVFDPVMAGIITIVQRQITSLSAKGLPPVNFIELAGGFGRSRYLFQRLNKMQGKHGTKVSQSDGDEPWTAIVRGAVLYGLTGTNLVQSRALREGFAVKHNPDFEEDEHDEDDRIRHPLRRAWVAQDQLLWFFHKGEDVMHGGVREHAFSFTFAVSETGFQEFDEPLFRSSADQPSMRLVEAKNSGSFAQHGTMKFRTPVPVENLRRDQRARYLDYKLRIEAVSGRFVKLTAVWDEDGSVIGTTEMAVSDE